MIRFTGYTGPIIGGDIIAKYILSRVEVSENNLVALLNNTCNIIAILFDRWISINNLSIFAINGK
jgi:hypothetical protein